MIWAFAGTLYLIRLTYQDFKNNMLIDDRYNFFMMGLSISLYSLFKHRFLYIIGIVAGILIISQLIKKLKVVGEGDTNAITWIFTGYAIIGIEKLIMFFLSFAIITTFYYVLKFIISKMVKGNVNQKMPFFIVILISFITTNLLAKLY